MLLINRGFSTMIGLSLLTLIACNSSQQVENEPLVSGINGQVVIGPSSANRQEEAYNNEEPYEAVIIIKDSVTDEILKKIKSDEEGQFHVELPPGEYLLVPETSSMMIPPFANPQLVVVEDGQFIQVKIFYDSGIR